MTDHRPLTDSLEEASVLLDGQQPLVPGTPDYERLYVERPRVETALIRESLRARKVERTFYWFFTGHTGSGKSTELNRILADETLSSYESVYIDLHEDLDLFNLDFTDLLLVTAQGLTRRADELGCAVPKSLGEAILGWGREVFTEEEIHTRTEGRAGLKVALPFLALSEEVRAGGGKRKVIRDKISSRVTDFAGHLNQLAEVLESHTRKRLLVVLDGMDHIDTEPAFALLNDHFRSLTLPRLSQIVVVPLSLLNESAFLATVGGRSPIVPLRGKWSTVPNVKVFESPGTGRLDPEGFAFYRDLVSRYISPDFFSEEALVSLCQLSAGIVREMIDYTGDACSVAATAKAEKVLPEHVEEIWGNVMRLYRGQFLVKDFEILRKVEASPFIEGVDGVAHLLHSKAVVFYPNGEGWYGVHPAVRRIINKSSIVGS